MSACGGCSSGGDTNLIAMLEKADRMEATLELTEKAAERLNQIVAAKTQPGEFMALRVMIRKGGCSGFEYGMGLDRKQREDDFVFTSGGATVLVDPQSMAFMKGSTIDYVDSLMGAGFSVNNPLVASSCGCGQSFKVAGQAGAPSSCSR